MLDQYWPTLESIDACIKNEAETADVSVLLAVHSPMTLTRVNEGSGNRTALSEQDLLDAFLTENVPPGALLLPITGASGAGKSHAIRWLDAQLRRSKKSHKLLIVRIPKSASLRRVVELILEPLPDTPDYRKAREHFKKAVTEVNPDEAAITFRAHLENALKARHIELLAEYKENPAKKELKPLCALARDIPKLFSDPALSEHYLDKVLARIVRGAIHGHPEAEEEKDQEAQFHNQDLFLPSEIQLSRASQPVQTFYQLHVANALDDKIASMTKLLNGALNSAIKHMFQLEQNTGGYTLQDIILSIRRNLLAEGRELVLLVEDFKALTGIQDTLLNVCIQEGEYDGKKIYATMRTALALTDGYLNLTFRDTILTRARAQWVVENQDANETEKLNRIKNLVGSYLNAARWGRTELQRLFEKRSDNDDLTNWLPTWVAENLDDTATATVAAFGSTRSGVPLFPFNETAIATLARHHLMHGGELDPNPRRVINTILRETLLMRPGFENGSFPPEHFHAITPNANVAQWVEQGSTPFPKKSRMRSLIAVWGGNPSGTAEIKQIPRYVFEAFQLPTENSAVLPQPSPAQNDEGSTSPSPNRPNASAEDTTNEAVDTHVEAMRVQLDAWASGTELKQQNANTLRKALMAIALDDLDWQNLQMKTSAFKVEHRDIHIPNARGNPTRENSYKLSRDHKDPDGKLRAGLLAAYRFVEIQRKSWAYPEGANDYIAVMPLVDHLQRQIEADLRAKAAARISDLRTPLINLARILGLKPALRPTNAPRILHALFSEADVVSGYGLDEQWDKALMVAQDRKADGKTIREVFQESVLEVAASYQGSGHTPHAIDIVRILEATAPKSPLGEIGLKALQSAMKAWTVERLIGQSRSMIGVLRSLSNELVEIASDSFDKNAFVEEMRQVAVKGPQTGYFGTLQFKIKSYEQHLADFSKSSVKDLSQRVLEVTTDGTDAAKILNGLGELDMDLLSKTRAILKETDELITMAERVAEQQERLEFGADPEQVAQEIERMLTELSVAHQNGTDEK